MFGQHHRLAEDFPEYKQRIHELKISNKHFAELFEQYNQLDNEIYRITEEIETPSDQYTESLKKKRLSLKDQLYDMLAKA